MKSLEAWWSPSQMISWDFLIGTVSAVINCTSPIIIPIVLFATLGVALAQKWNWPFPIGMAWATRVYIGIFTLRHAAPLVSQDAWISLFTSLHQYVLRHFLRQSTWHHLTIGGAPTICSVHKQPFTPWFVRAPFNPHVGNVTPAYRLALTPKDKPKEDLPRPVHKKHSNIYIYMRVCIYLYMHVYRIIYIIIYIYYVRACVCIYIHTVTHKLSLTSIDYWVLLGNDGPRALSAERTIYTGK